MYNEIVQSQILAYKDDDLMTIMRLCEGGEEEEGMRQGEQGLVACFT